MKKFLFITLLAFFFWGSVAHAALISISPYIPGLATASASSPGTYLVNLYDFALLFGGVLAFAAIVYGGVRYAFSAGNPSKLHEAREWIQSALLGLLLLAAAWIVLFTVNPGLVSLSLPTLATGSGTASAPVNSSGTSGGGSTACAAIGSCYDASTGKCSVCANGQSPTSGSGGMTQQQGSTACAAIGSCYNVSTGKCTSC